MRVYQFPHNAILFLVGLTGLEPVRPLGQLLLRQSRLPIPPQTRIVNVERSTGVEPIYSALQAVA
jgi:hypothetical protein